jgi:hypothetical protein
MLAWVKRAFSVVLCVAANALKLTAGLPLVFVSVLFFALSLPFAACVYVIFKWS